MGACIFNNNNNNIEDGGMHAAFDQNKSIYFENNFAPNFVVKFKSS